MHYLVKRGILFIVQGAFLGLFWNWHIRIAAFLHIKIYNIKLVLVFVHCGSIGSHVMLFLASLLSIVYNVI